MSYPGPWEEARAAYKARLKREAEERERQKDETERVRREKRTAQAEQQIRHGRTDRVVADQLAEGTTLKARASAGDNASRKQLIGTTLTEWDAELGEYRPIEEREE